MISSKKSEPTLLRFATESELSFPTVKVDIYAGLDLIAEIVIDLEQMVEEPKGTFTLQAEGVRVVIVPAEDSIVVRYNGDTFKVSERETRRMRLQDAILASHSGGSDSDVYRGPTPWSGRELDTLADAMRTYVEGQRPVIPPTSIDELFERWESQEQEMGFVSDESYVILTFQKKPDGPSVSVKMTEGHSAKPPIELQGNGDEGRVVFEGEGCRIEVLLHGQSHGPEVFFSYKRVPFRRDKFDIRKVLGLLEWPKGFQAPEASGSGECLWKLRPDIPF